MAAVLDTDPAKLAAFPDLAAAATPLELAQQVEVVVTALPMPQHVSAVFEGAQGLLAGLGEGKVRKTLTCCRCSQPPLLLLTTVL